MKPYDTYILCAPGNREEHNDTFISSTLNTLINILRLKFADATKKYRMDCNFNTRIEVCVEYPKRKKNAKQIILGWNKEDFVWYATELNSGMNF